MTRNLIEIPQLTDDGRLYHHALLDTVEALIPNAPYRSCHAADLLELENGDLLCVWFAGSSEGNADISIVGSRLKAGESQWSSPVKISDDPTRSEQNPSLFQHPNGENLGGIYGAGCPHGRYPCTRQLAGHGGDSLQKNHRSGKNLGKNRSAV